MRSFLLLNLLLENADIVGLGDIGDSEDFCWSVIEKQAVERERRHRKKLENWVGPVTALLTVRPSATHIFSPSLHLVLEGPCAGNGAFTSVRSRHPLVYPNQTRCCNIRLAYGQFPEEPSYGGTRQRMCTHIHLEAPESPPLAGSRDSYLGYSARSTWKRSW